jgi:hypothetical protein
MDEEAKIAIVRMAATAGPDLAPKILKTVDDYLAEVTPNTPLGSKAWCDKLHSRLMADLPGSAVAFYLIGECEKNKVVSVQLLEKAHFLGVAAEVEDASNRGDRDMVEVKQAQLNTLVYESFDALPDPRDCMNAYLGFWAKMTKAREEFAAKKKRKE